MKVTVLGSGTSTGVPTIGCDCFVCLSRDPKDKRTRSSVMIQNQNHPPLVIDTGPDFRAQMLRHQVKAIGGVLYTHTHADHCHGFDDLRAFSFGHRQPLPCFALAEYVADLKNRFSYAFQDTGYEGARPMVDLKVMPEEAFSFAGLEIEPVVLPHGPFRSSGFRVGEFAYVTDFKGFPEEVLTRWRGKIKIMIASGIHFGEHKSHSVIPETVELMEQLEVEQGFLTHLSHRVSHTQDAHRLPSQVKFAFDGMVIDL